MQTPRTLLIDDLRRFRDARPATVARTSHEALTILQASPDAVWDEVWLDHDLGLLSSGIPDTIMVIVDYFCERAFNDNPVDVGLIKVHTSNPVGAQQMAVSLERFGYNIQRVQAEQFFIV